MPILPIMVSSIDLYNHRSSDDFSSVLQNYLYQNCDNPQRVKVFNPIKGVFEYRNDIPCGRCWHCCQSRSADWVTRMFLHNEDWPFRYFITLTYRPIYSLDDSLDKFLYDYIAETLPLQDSDNSTNTFAYHPCVLSRSHLRNYFKRLRASVNVPISYFAVGEYGKGFGRPHYHAVVWSKEPLNFDLLKNAWSLSLCKVGDDLRPFRGQKGVELVRCSIGDVDVCDLNKPRYSLNVKNGQMGTLNDVFKYVAKYVNKYDKYTDIEQQNTFDESQNNNNDSNITKTTIFGVKSLRLCKIFSNFADEILNNRYLYECKQIKNFNLNDTTLYESNDPLYSYSPCKLIKRLQPFGVASCKHAIGKEYFERNRSLLSHGLLKPSLPLETPCRFPNYFSRKIREEKCRFRLCKIQTRTRNGKNFLCSSLSYGNLPLLSRSLRSLSLNAENCTLFADCLGQLARKTSRIADNLTYDCELMFWDFKTRSYFKYDDFLNEFVGYERKNNTFKRNYTSLSVADFSREFINGFNELKNEYEKFESIRMLHSQCLDSVRSLDNFSSTYIAARNELYSNLALHQKLYYAKRQTYARNI